MRGFDRARRVGTVVPRSLHSRMGGHVADDPSAHAPASGMEPPLVDVSGVRRTYDGFTALDGVSLQIAAGELVTVYGPSGSGKSTLLNVIGGLDRPNGGSITIKGADITKLSEARLAQFRRAHIGFVFQFFNLLANL